MPSGGIMEKEMAHIDVPLSNFSSEIGQTDGFIAERLFPVLPVKKESDLYWVHDTEHLQTNIDTRRADGAPSNRIRLAKDTASYRCDEYSLSSVITVRERNNTDSAINIEMDMIAALKGQLLLSKEHRVRDAVWNANNYLTGLKGSPTVKWGDDAAVIETNIDDAKEAIEGRIGRSPNVIVIPSLVARVIKRHPRIREIVKYTHSDLLIDGELPSVLWGLAVWIPGGIEDSQKFLARTQAIHKVWNADNVVIAYVNTSPGLKTLNFGTTFRVNIGPKGIGDRVKVWESPEISGDVYEVAQIEDNRMTHPACGYLYDNVI